MGCRCIDVYQEYIAKYIPYSNIYANLKFPNIDDINNEELSNILELLNDKKIIKQCIIQQYNEILIYQNSSIEQKNFLAPQCQIIYDKNHNLPTIFYPKFTPLVEEDVVWKTSTKDLPVLVGIELQKLKVDFTIYKNFISKVIDFCEEWNLREDDILLNPSNIGYHPLLGLRIIDYGLTNDNNLVF